MTLGHCLKVIVDQKNYIGHYKSNRTLALALAFEDAKKYSILYS